MTHFQQHAIYENFQPYMHFRNLFDTLVGHRYKATLHTLLPTTPLALTT